MTKNMLSFIGKLAFAAILVVSVCGWLPFTAPVTINTDPAGATVYDLTTGEELGTTPFDTRVFTKEKLLEIRKEGYFTEKTRINHDSPRTIDIELRRLYPVIVYSLPEKAAVYPAGSDMPIGRTPFKVDISENDTALVLKKAGYHDTAVTVAMGAEESVTAELKRLPTIQLSSTPAGATVLENGKAIGTTPFNPKAESERKLEITKDGYYSKNITVSMDSPPQVAVELKQMPIVSIQSSPAGAKIYNKATGKLAGTAPAQLLVEKETEFEIRADRYYSKTVTVKPAPNQKVSATLQAKPYVTVNSSPAGAKVYSGGKLLGTAPVELLVEKSTSVELRKEGYEAATKTIANASAPTVTVTLTEIPVVVAEEVETNATAAAETETQAVSSTEEKPAAVEKKVTTTEIKPQEASEEEAAAREIIGGLSASQLLMRIGGAIVVIVAALLLIKKKKK